MPRRLTVSLLGDSMTDTLGPACLPLREALEEAFPDIAWVFRNHGVSGTRADYGLYRLTRDYPRDGGVVKSVAYDDPDLIIVESFAYNHIIDRAEGLPHYRAALDAIVDGIAASTRARVLFVRTIPPDHHAFLDGVPNYFGVPASDRARLAAVVDLYMAEAASWAATRDVLCADAYGAARAAIAGGIPHRLFVDPADNIHPSLFGHRFVARQIVDTLAREKARLLPS